MLYCIPATLDFEYLTGTDVRKRKLCVAPYSGSNVCRIYACMALYGGTIREGAPVQNAIS